MVKLYFDLVQYFILNFHFATVKIYSLYTFKTPRLCFYCPVWRMEGQETKP